MIGRLPKKPGPAFPLPGRSALVEEVQSVTAQVPRGGGGYHERLVHALRAKNFVVRTSVQGIDIKRPGDQLPVFLRWPEKRQ